MQQDTVNLLGKFKYVIVVTLCILIANISTDDSAEIGIPTTQDPIISTSLETEFSTTEDEITTTSTSVDSTILITTEITELFEKSTHEIVSSTTENAETITQEEVSITSITNVEQITTESDISSEIDILSTSNIIKSEDLKVDLCGVINDCIKCVKSSDSCTWLVNENVCKSPDAGSRNATSGLVIENENFPGDVNRKGASFCPRIVSLKNITAPSDTHKMIKIKVSMKNLFVAPSQFSCRFGDGPGAIITSATLLVDTIYCSNAFFSYPSDEPFLQLPLSVLYSGHELSNPKDIKLIIYKCRYMGSNCISCFSFGRNYECGWCPGSSTCEIAGQCEETTVENLWIGRRGFCPQFTQ